MILIIGEIRCGIFGNYVIFTTFIYKSKTSKIKGLLKKIKRSIVEIVLVIEGNDYEPCS